MPLFDSKAAPLQNDIYRWVFKIIECLKCLKTSPWNSLFICEKKNWVCLFPTILRTHKWPPENQKYLAYPNYLPKSSKINKCWFVFKFLRQIFRIPPEVPRIWFSRSYDCFWQNYDLLKSKWFLRNHALRAKPAIVFLCGGRGFFFWCFSFFVFWLRASMSFVNSYFQS